MALRIAVALAQIGEFSFIVAAVGAQLGLVTDDVRNTLIATAIVSIAVNPLLYRAVAPLERWVPQRRSGGRDARPDRPSRRAPPTATRGIVRSSSAMAPSAEPSPGSCARTTLRRRSSTSTSTPSAPCATKGLPAIYGDAGHRDTLVSAGVPTAGAIILSVAGLAAAKEVITMARELNPSILILARTAYIRELVTLKQAGATVVYSGEGEVALAFTETILGRLGATPEQIDRERARVHEEILAPQAS